MSAASAFSLDDFLALRSHHSPALSDDGSTVAWISDAGGLDQVWSMTLVDGATPVRRTSLAEKVQFLSFRPRSRDLLFTTDRGGDERHQIRLLREGAADPVHLTDDPRWLHMPGGFDPFGTTLAYASNARDPRHMDVHLLDVETGATRTLITGNGWRVPLRFSADGNHLIVLDETVSSQNAALRILDLATGAIRTLVETGRRAKFASARFFDGGRSVIAVTDLDAEWHSLVRFDLETETMTRLHAPEADVELVSLSRDERKMAVAVNRNGVTEILVRIDGGDWTVVPGLPRGRATSLVFDLQGEALFVALSRFEAPTALWRLSLAGESCLIAGDMSPLTQRCLAPASVRIPSFDGREVPVFVFEPAERRPGRPALVFVHGGPEMQYAAHWRADVQYLVNCGWTVLAPNVRGSTGYGRAWHEADDRALRMDAVRDLAAVRAWLADRPGIDADRLAVFGQSYGGFMVLAALIDEPVGWCAGAEFYGIADFNTMLATTGPWRRTLRAAEYGDPDAPGGAAMLAGFSPLPRLGAIRAPLFIAHGSEDPRVPPSESELVVAVLRGLGHPVEIVRIPYEGHGFARIDNRRTAYGALVAFLERIVGMH